MASTAKMWPTPIDGHGRPRRVLLAPGGLLRPDESGIIASPLKACRIQLFPGRTVTI